MMINYFYDLDTHHLKNKQPNQDELVLKQFSDFYKNQLQIINHHLP